MNSLQNWRMFLVSFVFSMQNLKIFFKCGFRFLILKCRYQRLVLLKITKVTLVISDPVRPKLDKGTILAESILAVNELRADIARMKSEHIALSDESRDVSFYSPTHCYRRVCTQ